MNQTYQELKEDLEKYIEEHWISGGEERIPDYDGEQSSVKADSSTAESRNGK